VVFVRDGQADLVVAGESYDDLLRNDVIPARMHKKDVRTLAK
jgi:diaminopimelate decarboxylase